MEFDFLVNIHMWVFSTLLHPKSGQMLSGLFGLFCHLWRDPGCRYRFDLYHQIAVDVVHHSVNSSYSTKVHLMVRRKRLCHLNVILIRSVSSPGWRHCRSQPEFLTYRAPMSFRNYLLPQLSVAQMQPRWMKRHMTWCTVWTLCIQVTSKCSAKG